MVVFPEPDSPTSPSVSRVPSENENAVHRPQRRPSPSAGVLDGQLPHIQQRSRLAHRSAASWSRWMQRVSRPAAELSSGTGRS